MIIKNCLPDGWVHSCSKSEYHVYTSTDMRYEVRMARLDNEGFKRAQLDRTEMHPDGGYRGLAQTVPFLDKPHAIRCTTWLMRTADKRNKNYKNGRNPNQKRR